MSALDRETLEGPTPERDDWMERVLQAIEHYASYRPLDRTTHPELQAKAAMIAILEERAAAPQVEAELLNAVKKHVAMNPCRNHDLRDTCTNCQIRFALYKMGLFKPPTTTPTPDEPKEAL